MTDRSIRNRWDCDACPFRLAMRVHSASFRLDILLLSRVSSSYFSGSGETAKTASIWGWRSGMTTPFVNHVARLLRT
jgi:hypothetical protein